MANKKKSIENAVVPGKPGLHKYYLRELFIFSFSFLLYINSIPNDYSMDDELVTNHHKLTSKGISAIPEIFSTNYYQDESGTKYEYRPIVLSSFAVEHSFFGDNPHVSHFFNILLYALLCTLLFIVLKKLLLGYNELFSFIVVLIFIVHPAHTEVVDSIKNRDELFALLFALLSLYASLLWIDSSRLWLASVPVFIVLAVFSKFSVIPVLLTSPVLLLFFRQISRKRYATIAAINTLVIFFVTPVSNLQKQVLFLLTCLLFFISIYLLLNLSWTEIPGLVRSALLRISGLASSVQSKLLTVKKRAAAISSNEEGSLTSRELVLSVTGCLLLSSLIFYLFFMFTIWPTAICLSGYPVLYFRAGSRYRKVILPFAVFTGIILSYFLKDHAGLVGFTLLCLIVINIDYKEISTSYLVLLIFFFAVFILWPYDRINFADHSGLGGFCLACLIVINIYLRKISTPYILILLFFFGVVILWPYDHLKFIVPLIFLLPKSWQKWLLFVPIFLTGMMVLHMIDIFGSNYCHGDLILGLIPFWIFFWMLHSGKSVLKVTTAILICLPIMVAMTSYDGSHNTLFFAKNYVSVTHELKPKINKAAVNKGLESAGEKLQTAKNELQTAFDTTLIKIATEEVVSDSAQVKKVIPRKSVSLIQDIMSRSNRPVLFLELPITGRDPQEVKIATGADLMMRYLQLVIFPYPLSYYYGFSEIKAMHINQPKVILELLIIALLLVISIYYVQKKELIGLSLLTFFILLLPDCLLLVPVAGVFADRFLFFPSLFIAIIIVRLVIGNHNNALFDKNLRWQSFTVSKKAAIVSICAIFCVLTIVRTSQWKNYLTLFRHDIKYVPNSAQAHNLLAVWLVKSSFDTVNSPVMQQELRKEALQHFKRSIMIYPNFFNTNYDLGRDFMLLNEADSAIFWFKKSIAIDSSFPGAYTNIAQLDMELGRNDEAIAYSEAIVHKWPRDYDGYDLLGKLYTKNSKYDSAIAIYQTAIAKFPTDSKAYLDLSKAYFEDHKSDSAKLWLDKVLQLNPGDPEAIYLLKNLEKAQF